MGVLFSVVVLVSCGTDDGGGPSGDAAGRQSCSRFRDLAADAFAEALSERQVVSGLQVVGSLAEDSTNPAIKDTGVAVGEEANAETLISGEPNPAQDALADACNTAYPI